MTYAVWLAIGIVSLLLVALLWNLAPTEVLFVTASTLLAATGIISADEAFAGFSNSGVLTVAFLFVVVAGLRETGVLDQIGHHVLGNAKAQRNVLMLLATIVMPMSALLNNTPIVPMFVPIVMDWCRRHQVSPSKLLIPLSYLTILGGTCTLIGTSTNLVVDGLLKQNGKPGLSLWKLGKVGVSYAIVGAGYLFLFGRKLLPDRAEPLQQLGDARRDYVVEMCVEPTCCLAGKTVEAGGLRHLPVLFLIEIDRAGEPITPVRAEDYIEAGDRLVFAGVVDGIIELEKIQGLVSVFDQDENWTAAERHNPAFYLVSMGDQWRPICRERAWIAIAIFCMLIVLMTTGWIPIAIATALQNSGAASVVAGMIVDNMWWLGPVAALAMLYAFVLLLTEVITNNAAAVLIFPFCLELAKLYDVDSRPFLIALTLAASASFMTPIGYQTDMMVFGPGGNRFADFLRIGAPLNLVLGIVAVIIMPIFLTF